MFSIFQKIVITATMIIKLFVCKDCRLLPLYISDLKCNNNNNARCLDGDMDSVFF